MLLVRLLLQRKRERTCNDPSIRAGRQASQYAAVGDDPIQDGEYYFFPLLGVLYKASHIPS